MYCVLLSDLNNALLWVPTVLSTAPKKYAVVESKGFIKAHCCVDM